MPRNHLPLALCSFSKHYPVPFPFSSRGRGDSDEARISLRSGKDVKESRSILTNLGELKSLVDRSRNTVSVEHRFRGKFARPRVTVSIRFASVFVFSPLAPFRHVYLQLEDIKFTSGQPRHHFSARSPVHTRPRKFAGLSSLLPRFSTGERQLKFSRVYLPRPTLSPQFFAAD